MNSLILAILLTCPTTKVVNHTKIWTDQDQKSLEFNKNSCKRWFGSEAPCLKVFGKRAERTYYAICSAETKGSL